MNLERWLKLCSLFLARRLHGDGTALGGAESPETRHQRIALVYKKNTRSIRVFKLGKSR